MVEEPFEENHSVYDALSRLHLNIQQLEIKFNRLCKYTNLTNCKDILQILMFVKLLVWHLTNENSQA